MSDQKTILRYALLSHAIEKYDIFLYGFLIPSVSFHFFPESRAVAILLAYAAFASGYLVRPIGALYFGYIGDKYGRKKAYLSAVFMGILPTTIIGLLPYYEQIGLLSPILLLLCRVMQGISSGGEFTGVSIYLSESYSDKQLGHVNALIRSIGFIGVGLGTLTGLLCQLSFMPAWSWRVPFLLASVLTYVVYRIRNKMPEPEQQPSQRLKENHRLPIINAFRESKMPLFYMMTISAFTYSMLYFSTVYLGNLYKSELGFAESAMLINTIMVVIWGIMTYFSGQIADRVGIVKYLVMVCIAIVAIIVPLYRLFFAFDFYSILFMQTLFCVLGSLLLGPMSSLFKLLFPPEYRYSASSFSNTVGQAAIGASVPLYAKLLVMKTGVIYAPVLIVLFTGGLAIFSMLRIYVQDRSGQQVDQFGELADERDLRYS